MNARQMTDKGLGGACRAFARAISALVMAAICMQSAPAAVRDLESDTWVATDAIGRALPAYSQCGPPKAGKYVGMFYCLWHGEHTTTGPWDMSKILAANPKKPAWGPLQDFHHWGEPELGYYLSNDAYVMRKHAQMLTDAGVDTLILDATNGYPYTSNYMLLLGIYEDIRSKGGMTPQVCFFLNPANNGLAQTLYNDLYSKNLYSDLWFRWKGKPLILTSPKGLPSALREFFTFRKTWGLQECDEPDEWSFMQIFPQTYGWHTRGIPEEIAVSPAQQKTYMNAVYKGVWTAHGRSFRKYKTPPANRRDYSGHNYAEQWDRALAVDPDFVFITSWNEWVAMRFENSSGKTLFVDQYGEEYSRDVEPMKGGHTDSYYYQTISYIRRFKGVRKPSGASKPKRIVIDGKFGDWKDVKPEYKDTIGDTEHRDSVGWGKAGRYINNTGRNDLVLLKTAWDSKDVYFYAETADTITPRTDPNWMLLFIDSDRNAKTGRQGYDYLINCEPTSSTTTTVSRSASGGKWKTAAKASYRVAGNQMEIAVPRAAIGLGKGRGVRFYFHWADNIQKPNDIIEFCVNGDSAPNRRFNYSFDSCSH